MAKKKKKIDLLSELSMASMNGYLMAVAGLLEEGAKEYSGDSEPALNAAQFGHDKCLSLLLAAGWSQDGIDAREEKKGVSLLHVAAGSGSRDCLNVLLGSGAVLVVDARGRTPLHAIFENDYVTDDQRILCVGVLLEAGCSLDRQDAEGMTALMRAAQKGSAISVERLWAAGAQVGLLDKSGRSALDLATERYESNSFLRAQASECVSLLSTLMESEELARTVGGPRANGATARL